MLYPLHSCLCLCKLSWKEKTGLKKCLKVQNKKQFLPPSNSPCSCHSQRNVPKFLSESEAIVSPDKRANAFNTQLRKFGENNPTTAHFKA